MISPCRDTTGRWPRPSSRSGASCICRWWPRVWRQSTVRFPARRGMRCRAGLPVQPAGWTGYAASDPRGDSSLANWTCLRPDMAA
jgi:hypothetical protein